jgi:hypothetical protein
VIWHLLAANPVRVDNELVKPVSSVRNRGILLDSELSMNNHIAKVNTACFTTRAFEALVVATERSRSSPPESGWLP